jgi:von Willebrand factor type A domain
MKAPAWRLLSAVLFSLLVHAGLVLTLRNLPQPAESPPDIPDHSPDLHLSIAPLEPHRPTRPQPSVTPLESVLVAPRLSTPPSIPNIADGQTHSSTSGGTGRFVSAPAGGVLSPLVGQATSVVFVLDRSVSMGPSGALARARRDLVTCLDALPETTTFQVIAYNRAAEPMKLAGRTDLVPARKVNLEEAVRQVRELLPSGGTDHARALRRALLLRPGAIVFLTDADDLHRQDVSELTRLNARKARIHVVELNGYRGPGINLLRQLAEDNGGTYRRLSPRE